jgi:hypothetical protein
VSRKYANDKKWRVDAQECQRRHYTIMALEKARCNGAQHEEIWCMTNIAQQLLENSE